MNERPRVVGTNADKSLRLAEDQDFQDRESAHVFMCTVAFRRRAEYYIGGRGKDEMQGRILKIMKKEDREFIISKSRCSKIALIQGHMSRTFSTADSRDITSIL